MDRRELTIVPATPEEIELVVAILNEAAQWIVDRAAEGWRPGQWRKERLLEAIERGETFLARRDGRVVATISLQWMDELFWGTSPADAGYVHRLAVATRAHGSGIGRRLLAWAERVAIERGRSLIRLDCACENPRLRAYYEALGFSLRGEKTLTGRWGTYCAALYEKALTAKEAVTG